MEATIVSIMPYTLNDPKPGLRPPSFEIPAAPENDFVVVHIHDCLSSTYRLDGESIDRIVSGMEVGASIVNDHVRSVMASSPTAFPGIKCLPGRHEKSAIKAQFSKEIAGLRETQNAWFAELVKIADDAWSNPLNPAKNRSITDVQKLAAKRLGLNREWVTSIRVDQVQCPACRIYIPSDATICYNCKTSLVQEKKA